MKTKENTELVMENERLREQLQFYQEYDLLTGLYNKNTFYEKTSEYIRCHPNQEIDIICVDVERFKLVNDLYGTEQGDDLLRYLAGGIREAFDPKQSCAGRISADVFGLCLPHDDRQRAEEAVTHIFRNYPLDMDIIPAIGIYRVEDREVRVSLMCDRAVMALNSIKGNYLKNSAEYDSQLRTVLIEEQEIINSMDYALENREFKVFYQPKCNMCTGKVVGAEALVRWQHPQKGMIPPSDFIPIFEKSGFIKKLDMYVWEEVACWLRDWMDRGHKAVPVSVNISRIDIYAMDICEIMKALVEKYSLAPSLLELEITESAYTNRPEEIIKTLDRLLGMGFTVLMDDFGSGYSSLNMLKDINVDILKIDMRFLDRSDQKSKDILESVVHMGKWLNLPVIAEGVENHDQMDFLRKIGCLYAQGYFYYRPMPVEAYECLLLDDRKIDYEDGGKLKAGQESILDFRELFHTDMMSDRLLENILGAIALYSFDGRFLKILRGNEKYYDLVDRPEEENLDNLLDTVVTEDRPLLLDGIQKAIDDDVEQGVELRFRHKRRQGFRWIQMNLFHLSEAGGHSIFYASLADVTEHMAAVEALRMSEQRFQAAMEATNIIIFELDIRKREAHYSEYARKAFGLETMVSGAPEGFIEQGTVCEESAEDFRRVYEDIYNGADKAVGVIRSIMGDGSIAWNRLTLTSIKDKSGKAVSAVGMVENVTREKELEEKLERRKN